MSMESHGGMILTGKNQITRRETFPSATLTTMNPTWTDLRVNPGLYHFKLSTRHEEECNKLRCAERWRTKYGIRKHTVILFVGLSLSDINSEELFLPLVSTTEFCDALHNERTSIISLQASCIFTC
jgi:hypothetical protein